MKFPDSISIRCFRYLFIIPIACIFIKECHAQDSLLYKKAIYFTVKGEHSRAKDICRYILQKNPDQVNAGVLLGRLYSWDRQFDSSIVILQNIVIEHPEDKEALNALINTERWSGNLDQALVYANKGLSMDSSSEKLLLQKAKILDRLNKHGEAVNTIGRMLFFYPGNAAAINFLKYLENEKTLQSERHGVGISYVHDAFNKKYSPWNYTSIYLFSRGKHGAISAEVNYANRFNTNGMQYEISLYPKISHVVSAYINAGYSSSIIFPNYKLGASLYYDIARKSEVELGIRYLNFTILQYPIVAFTGSFRIYVNKLRLSIRPYIIPQKTGFDQSYYFTIRYYLPNPENNITLTLNTGLSPKEYFDPSLNAPTKFHSKTQRAIIYIQHTFFSPKNIIKATIGYERRAYYNQAGLNRFTSGLSLERLF